MSPAHCFACSTEPKPLDAEGRCRCGNAYTDIPGGRPPAQLTTYGTVDGEGRQRAMIRWVESNGRIRGQVFRAVLATLEPWLAQFDLVRIHKEHL